jgi:hypothetical protein
MYHEDAVLEFPQSGERFEGLANFREWRRQYPADLRFRVRRMTVGENLAVVECSISYSGGPWQYGFNCSSSGATKWPVNGSTSWRDGRLPSGGRPGEPVPARRRPSEPGLRHWTAHRVRSKERW